MSVTVYTRPNCVQCTATHRKLNMLGIPYTTVDIDDDPEARDRVAGWGYRQVPVVEVGPDHHWSGYRADLLAELVRPATP